MLSCLTTVFPGASLSHGETLLLKSLNKSQLCFILAHPEIPFYIKAKDLVLPKLRSLKRLRDSLGLLWAVGTKSHVSVLVTTDRITLWHQAETPVFPRTPADFDAPQFSSTEKSVFTLSPALTAELGTMCV